MISILKRKEKNQKITKTKKEKFVKESSYHQSSFIFENKSRFRSFHRKKKLINSFNKLVMNEIRQFRKHI